MHADQAEVVQRYRSLTELVPAHWQTGSIEVEDGSRIHYTRTGGAKPVVLLLHGLQGAGLMWLRTARALEATYDLVMPDLRAHGRSSRAETSWSIDLLVKDLRALLGTLEVERPCIVGHSLGADIAGRLAASGSARAVVLVDPALRNISAMLAMDPETPPPWMQPIIEAMRALQTQPHEQRLMTGLRLIPPGAPAWNEADYVSFVEAQAQFDLTTYRYTAGMTYLFEEPQVIARIGCPILLLTARQIPGTDIEASVAVWKRHWRDGRHIHFADSGHFIPCEQFDRFVDVLAPFLNEHEAAPGEPRQHRSRHLSR